VQPIDPNKMVFSLSLAGAFIFGVLFAAVVRKMSKRKMVAQVAWMVVVGVTATLLSMIPVFGLQNVAVMFLFFAASGIPMISEYILRVTKEAEDDAEKAKGLAKDLFE
jgi:predicted MFS family arabinose efflux permease